MKRVMVFGAFDGLHPGHVDFFRQAKEHGDYLIVSVGTDKNVEKIKGRVPHFNQTERMSLIGACKIVDQTVLGAEHDFYAGIKKLIPDVICLGYDQWAEEDVVRAELGKIGLMATQVIRLKPYKENKAKSSIMKSNSVDFE